MAILLKENDLQALKSHEINLITGSFDLLHAGHVKFLKTAKEISPTIPLLVIVLDDKNIAIRKGLDRPIYPLADRLIMLKAILYIDYLFAWHKHWKELADFITKLKIKIYFVNELDPGFSNKQKIALKNGIEIVSIARYKDLSTSSLIKRIQYNVQK